MGNRCMAGSPTDVVGVDHGGKGSYQLEESGSASTPFVPSEAERLRRQSAPEQIMV